MQHMFFYKVFDKNTGNMKEKKRISFKTKPSDVQTDNSKQSHKISDIDFWTCMYKSYGIMSRAVKVIKRDFQIDITRQAVHDRATKDKAKLQECREAIVDLAEETIIDVSITGNKKERLDASKTILKTLGRSRGWDEKIAIEHSGEMIVKSVKVEHLTTGVPLASNENEIDTQQ